MSRRLLSALLLAFVASPSVVTLGARQPASPAGPLRFEISYPALRSETPLTGRLLLILSTRKDGEPRFHVNDGPTGQPVFGLDLERWPGGAPASVAGPTIGFPVQRLSEIPAGTYRVQALFHRYETFRRSDGQTVQLPMDRGEGQQWNQAPGNLYSTPREITIDPVTSGAVSILLDQIIPEIAPPKDTKYIRHERIQSALLTKFWGRPMHLGANVLLPEGWDTHPDAKYPLFIYHGHFPATFTGFRETPPDADLKPDFSARFNLDGLQPHPAAVRPSVLQGLDRAELPARDRHRDPARQPVLRRLLCGELGQPRPLWRCHRAGADSLHRAEVPRARRRLVALHVRRLDRRLGSDGGADLLSRSLQRRLHRLPGPDRLPRLHLHRSLQGQNAFWLDNTFKQTPRPGHRNYLGHVDSMVWEQNRLELVLGGKTRSGQQFDVWEAVYSPVGDDGYPARIFDKASGVINRQVAEYWRENYDLTHILQRDWDKGLGKKLEGKLHLYVGDMDNYYLNNAVYLAEQFLESTKNPYYNGEVAYGDRAEHCWNGDPTRENAYSRLRYHQMYIPKAVERMLKTAPGGADLTSWRY